MGVKLFFLGFLTASLIFGSILIVQKLSYEKQKISLIASLSTENHKDKQTIRKQWKEIVWLRGRIKNG